MSKPILYVDMDGVLCDMEASYVEHFGITPLQARDLGKEKYDSLWDTFVYYRAFKSLPMHAGADKLIEFFKSIENDVTVAILSSSSGLDSHAKVQHDKMIWLDDHDIKYPALIVPGRRYKKFYAEKNAFLIDDFDINVKEFISKGGSGVIHTNAFESIDTMDNWVQKQLEVA